MYASTRGARGTRESPVLTRSTKIVPLSFEPGSSATNLRAAERVLQSTLSTPSVPAQYPHSTHTVPRQQRDERAWLHTHTQTRTYERRHTQAHTHAPRLFARGGGSHLRAMCRCCGGTRRGTVGVLKWYCGGTQGASYYKHGTGPAAPARDVLMLGRRRELLPRDRLADLRRRAEDSSTAKSGTGGVRRRATW